MSDQERKVQLGFAVNTSEARQGFEDVAKAGESMATRLSASGARASKAVDGIGDGGEGASQKVDRAAKSIITSIQRTTAAMEAGERGSAAYFESLARQRGVSVDTLKPYLAQLDAARSKQDLAVRSLGGMEMSAKQTAAALRQVPMQFSDIAVSLASGQAPLTVLLQQGAQLKDSFGGVGAAARAMGGYVLGLVNPFTVAAAVVGGLAVAYEKGSQESAAFSRTLIQSGNVVGASADQLMAMAASINDVNSQISQSRAAEVLNAMAASGRIGVAQLEKYTAAAINFERAGGGSAETVQKAFEELAKDPLGATLKLNEGMNYLTESTYNQIKSLEQQGKTFEAARVAQEAYFAATQSQTKRLEETLGPLQIAWRAVTETAAKAWDAMLGVGRSETAADRIKDIERRLLERSTTSAPAFGETFAQRERETQRLRQELFQLRTQAARDALGAQYQGDAVRREKERIAFLSAGDKFLSSEAKKQKEIAQIQDLRLRNVISEAEAKERIAKIEASYAKAGGASRVTKDRGDQFASERAAAQSWADAFKDFADMASKAEAKTMGLSEAQRKLQEYLQSPAYANASEQMRQLVLEPAYAAIAADQAAEAFKREQDALQDLMKAEEERVRAQQRSASGVEGQLQKLLDEEQALAIAAASNITLAQAIEEVTIARLREAQAKELSFGNDGLAAEIQREIDARQKLKEAIGRKDQRDLVKKQAEDAQKEWQKTADSIERTLTDALMRGFESGKGFGESLADSLVNTFKTYVAKEIAAALSRAIMSAMAGQNWAGIVGNALGGGQGGGLTGNLVSRGVSSAVGNYASSAIGNYLGAGNTGALVGGATGSMSWGNVAGSIAANGAVGAGGAAAGGSIAADGLGTLLASNGAYGTAVSGAAATSAAGGASAGVMAGAQSALAAIPVWGWVAIAAIALWQPMFGRKLKEVGTQINFREGDVSTNDYKFEKGGWFRSDKTTMLGDTTAANKQLVQQAENIQESAKGMARALGFGTDAIDAFSGTVNVSMKGVKSSEEASQRYGEALQELQRQMLNTATGANMSKEAFADWMNGINQSIADAGISTSGIADILVQGMMGRLSQQEVGDQLADMIVGGIYNSIASNYAAQIASVFTAQIIQPIFVALAAGVPISQAISQQAIANVVQTAQQAAAAMNAIFSDPGFRQAIAGIEQAIGGVSAAVTSVRVPSFGSARTAARSAASQAADQEAQKRYQLETQLLQLLGRTGVLRQRELASLSAGNRELQIRIWALEDAKAGVNAAMEALQRAAEAQRTELQKQLDAALESEQALNDVFQVLRDNIRELRGEVDSTVSLGAAAGRDLIRQALAGMPIDGDELQSAIDAVRQFLERDQYRSKFERDRALLAFAGELESLSGVTEAGLSTAEQQVALLEEQLAGLDTQLELAQKQVDALFGVDTSVKTVTQAVQALSAAMATYTGAVAAASAVGVSTGAAPVSSGGGGYSGGGGGGYSAPKPAVKSVWTPQGYWDKNEDLRAYWTANGALLAKGRGWSRDDYLRWHWENVAKQGQAEMRAYAKGGYYPGGMALVGEDGPEIINFRQPGQVYTAGQTQELLGRGNDQMLAEIRGLREDNRAQSRAIAQLQARQAKLLERWNVEGLPAERLEA